MDLSFTLKSPDGAKLPKWVVSLADIKAAADIHRPDNGGVWVGGILRGQENAPDKVHVLACNIMPAGDGVIDTASLGGSFNPVVAQQLMVGTTR